MGSDIPTLKLLKADSSHPSSPSFLLPLSFLSFGEEMKFREHTIVYCSGVCFRSI